MSNKSKSRNPVSNKLKKIADTPEAEPHHPGAIVNVAQTEIDRLHSVIEQVDTDIEAGQIATAHARIKAALIHGQEPEPTPQE